MADLLVLVRPAKSEQNGGKNLSVYMLQYWACRKEESGLSTIKRAVGKNAGAAFAKRQRNRAACPEYQIMRGERVKMGKSRTLMRMGGSERGHREKRVDSTVKEGSF